MPKNKIQFQKGLSLPSFLQSYGTQEQCEKAIFSMRWPQGFVCPKCGCSTFYELTTRNIYQCSACKRQTSLISGTIFESTKLKLTTWLLAIYLLTQSKDGISSLNLSRTLGISANAALRMKHKLQHVMKLCDDSQALSNLVQIDDAYLGGKSQGGKRGRGAGGKTPFVAAIMTNEKGHPIFMRFSVVAGFHKKDISNWAKKHLCPGTSVVSDGLNCFPAVKDAGCSHHAIIKSSIKITERYSDFKWLDTMIGNVKNSIHGTYHSVSEKHVPRYLAEFCFRFNRRFELGKMIVQLAQAAVNTLPMPQRTLKLAEDWW
jgi:transposase-like protein